MKRLFFVFVCLVLCIFASEESLTKEGNFFSDVYVSEKKETGICKEKNLYLARRGYRGGRRGKRMGPSSKRKDLSQLNEGNKRGSEQKKNQNQSNEEKHQRGGDRKNDQNRRADEKNNERHRKN